MKRQENDISSSYKFCIIDAIEKSDEDQVRKVVVHYHNIEEKTDRFTRRSVSSLILIRKYDELNIWGMLINTLRLADSKFYIETQEDQEVSDEIGSWWGECGSK